MLNTDWLLESNQHTKRAYCTVGDLEINNQWNMPADLDAFVQRIKIRPIDKLELKYEVHENEMYNSVFPAALSNGIRHVFEEN